MKVVIVGAVAGGATFAASLRRLDETCEIVMFEKDRDLSFGNCEIPYYLSYEIENSSYLINRTPESFLKGYNIKAKRYHEVISINRKEKYVKVLDKENNTIFNETYDYLILAPGSKENRPSSISGYDNPHVFSVKNVVDVEKIRSYIEEEKVKNVFIAGGGFVAIETAESIHKLGNINISMLIRKNTSLLSIIDMDLKVFIKENIKENDVNIIEGKSLVEIDKNFVKFDDGSEENVDLVILALGARPYSDLAKNAGLNLEEYGSISVDDNFRTSDKAIFAIGDVINPINFITKEKTKLNLAWPAHRQAKFLAKYLLGKKANPPEFIGTFALRSFDLNIAMTGLNEDSLEKAGFSYESVLISHRDSVAIMPDSKPIYLKILFDKNDGTIYGAQGLGYGVVDKRIDVIASMIKRKATIYDLYELELAYQPLYSTVEDATNILANQAINIFEGKLKAIKIKDLIENYKGYEIYDLRDKNSYEKAHIKTAKSLAGINFRDDHSFLPRDKKIVLYDTNGGKSSNTAKLLANYGFDNIYILDGSFVFFEKYDKMAETNMINKNI